jgi:hypothetical protein
VLAGNSVSANIIDSTTDASDTTLVEADSTETVTGLAIAVGAGGIAGVAGAIAVVSRAAEVTADISNSNVNQDASFSNSNQNVTVKAKGTSRVSDTLGALGAGFNAGVGAGVAVITIKDTLDAHVGDNSRVSAEGNIDVEADGDKTFTSKAFSFAGGVARGNCTVSVIGVGVGLDDKGVNSLK